MAKKKTKKKKKALPCEQCNALCCRYVAVELETPDCRQDYDNIRWYLLHNNVKVFTNYDDEWYLEFVTDCSKLDDQGRCTGYTNRPQLCRDHGDDDDIQCEFMDNPYNLLFETAEQFEQWLDRQNIEWRKEK
jgi:hypothetical protein